MVTEANAPPHATIYVPPGDEPAFMAIRSGDFVSGRSQCLKLAERGSVDAMAVAGWMLFAAAGGERDLSRAERLLGDARANGSVYGTFGLAWLSHARGEFARCYALMAEAAGNEFSPAVLALGRLYLAGVGTAVNHARAESCYYTAVRQRHRAAPAALLGLWAFGRCGLVKQTLAKVLWTPVRAICAVLMGLKRFDKEGLIYDAPIRPAR